MRNDKTATPSRTGKQQQNFCRLKIQSVTQFPIVVLEERPGYSMWLDREIERISRWVE